MEEKILYILSAINDDSGENIAIIDALSIEGIQEQLHKVEGAVEKYKEKLNKTNYE